jgi:hypothetical protein
MEFPECQEREGKQQVIYCHSASEAIDNECRKQLHVMYGGSWDIMSRCVISMLRRAVAATALVPRAAPHHQWMETSITFDASDYPKNMVGAGKVSLVISSTITNIRMYHVLIDGGAALNLISLMAFQKLQIPMSRLSPFAPVFGCAPGLHHPTL